MISSNIVSLLTARGWWFEDTTPAYEAAILRLGVRADSEFSQFYLHADAGPSFLAGSTEIHQLCWHINHTNYIENSIALRAALGIPDEFIFLDSFSGGSGFVYRRSDECVYVIHLGPDLSDLKRGLLKPKYSNFNEFLEDLFLRS